MLPSLFTPARHIAMSGAVRCCGWGETTVERTARRAEYGGETMPDVPLPTVPFASNLEADLRAPVAAWLENALGPAVLADEIDLGWGAPDLVAALPVGLADRLAAEIEPISDPAQVWALSELAEPRLEAHLRTLTSTPWARYRTRVLDPLRDAGLVEQDDEGTWRLLRLPIDVFPRTVAVELKLRDWRRAISQAARYRAFAHASYIAMPISRLTQVALDTAEARGVGVLGVSPDGVLCLARAADRPPLDDRVRMLVSELTLASFLGLRRSAPAGSPRGRVSASVA